MYFVILRATNYIVRRYARITMNKLKWNIKKILNLKEGRKGKTKGTSRKQIIKW